jgi:hypothetical protein
VLVLRQSAEATPALGGVVRNVRDRLEDVVDGRGEFWARPHSRRLAVWAATVAGAALLIPAACTTALMAALMAVRMTAAGVPVVDLPTWLAGPGWPGEFASALLAATIAVLLGLIAALAAKADETHCAAICLLIACGWAGVAGAAATHAWLVSSMGPDAAPVLPAMVAAGTAVALLLAGGGAAVHPAAMVHLAALMTFGGVASIAAVAVATGAPGTGCLAALAAVLVIGAVPRVALALGGVSGIDPDRDPARLDELIIRSDHILTGSVAGLTLVVVVGGLPAALSTDGWHRLFALGLGVALFLRSRMFSQVRHVVAMRVGGLVAVAELCIGLAVGDPALLLPLILGPVALLTLAAAMTAGPGPSPVARARVGRALDLAEVALVVAMVVLAVGLLGWFGWVRTIIG